MIAATRKRVAGPLILGTLALGLVAAVPGAQAAWNQPVGGPSPINQANNQGAAEPRTSLAAVGDVPYVAWNETDGTNNEIRVSRLNAAGTAWEQPAGGPSPINQANNRNAFHPSLAAIGGVPHVAWLEFDGINNEVRVSRLNAAGTAWEQVVGGASPINQANNLSAIELNLAAIGGVPYVAWTEDDGVNRELRVSRLNTAGTAWEQPVGGASPINQANDHGAFEPSLAAIGGVPYVAWSEFDGTNNEIRVSRLNAAGTAWEQVVGGASPINQAPDLGASQPSLAAIGSVPYVAWSETDGTNSEVRVSRLNATGTAWEQVVGGASPINQANDRGASGPSLEVFGDVPYVAWGEIDGTNSEVRVSRLNAAGTAWEQVVGGASPINQASNRNAGQPSLAAIGGVPYIAWEEFDGTNTEVRVTRLEPEFLGPPTAAASDASAALSVQVRAFGLPYQVGFDFGPGFGSQTATTQTSGETETVTQAAAGLSPSTSYPYRPFATAGVPEPRVLGEVASFTTSATVPPDLSAPNLELSGRKTQRLGTSVKAKASCSAEACDLAATGRLIVGGGKAKRARRALRRLELKPAGGQVPAGGRATLKLRVPRKARAAAAKALDQGGKARAKIVVTASDSAGNSTTGRRKVKLVS